MNRDGPGRAEQIDAAGEMDLEAGENQGDDAQGHDPMPEPLISREDILPAGGEGMGRMAASAYQAITAMHGHPQDHAEQHEQPQAVGPVFAGEAEKVKVVLDLGCCFPDQVAVGGSLNTPGDDAAILPGRNLAARSPGSQHHVIFKSGIGSMTGGAIRQGLTASGNPVTDLVKLHLRPDGGIFDTGGHQELFHHLAFCRRIQLEFRPCQFAVVVLIQGGEEFGPELAVFASAPAAGFPGKWAPGCRPRSNTSGSPG